MYIDVDKKCKNEDFIKADKLMCATCLGWSDLTIEERVKIYSRAFIVKGVEMGEWHYEGGDYINWAVDMFKETGLCFSKYHYDYVFGNLSMDDGIQKAVNYNGRSIFNYNSSGREKEIEELLRQLRSLRMEKFDKIHSPELVTEMYYIGQTDREIEILKELHRMGFPHI